MSDRPVERLLKRLHGVRRSGDGWIALCPVHEGDGRKHRPSLSVGEGSDACAVVNCFAGCPTGDVLASVGMKLTDLFPADQRRVGSASSEPDVTYEYLDEDGRLLFQVCRFPGKRFLQRRPDGNGGWIWRLGDTRRVVYRLDRLADLAGDSAAEKTLYIVEGENDVHAIEGAGGIATCNPGGAGKWRDEYAEMLGFGHVVVVADRDEPGEQHAKQVAESLARVGIAAEIVHAAAGKDAADHLAAGHSLDELVPVETDTCQPSDSWSPQNLALLGNRPRILPTLGGLGLVYPGKRHSFTGPQESAKTIVAYAALLGVVRDGQTALLIDFEMGEYDARDRLSEMGATADEFERILYLAPETQPTADTIKFLADLNPALVVIDAAAGAYQLTQLDDNKRADVELFQAVWVRPFWRQGIATIVLDHVVKNIDSRGKYAIGSERKVGGIDVHLGFEVILELSRGGRGLYKISTHKDRPAHLPRPKAAELEITSDPDTHKLTWTFREPHERDDGAATFRPTVLMERVSRYLEQQAEPVSRTTVETNVAGKVEYLRKALDTLVAEHYVGEQRGTRNARLVSSRRPFRALDPVPTPSPQHHPDPVPTPSQLTPLNQAETRTPSQPVPTPSLLPEPTPSPGACSPTGEPPEPGRGHNDAESDEIERLAPRAEKATR